MKIGEAKETIIEMRNQGYGYKRIAKALNANPSSVKRWIVKLGLPSVLDSSKPENAREAQCESCDKYFKTIRHNARYCSDACRLRARKIRMNGRKECKRCDKPIMGLQNVDHCSVECREMYSISKRTIRLVRICCVNCGTHKLSRYKTSYCAVACREKDRKEKDRLWYQDNREYLLKKMLEQRELLKVQHNNKCKECGRFFVTTRKRSAYCDTSCANRYSNRRREVKRRKKIISNGKVDWSISIERLTKRDGKSCYICGDKMNYSVDYNHNDYPNIEHVKPISKGGTHTWDNVKLAHRHCNIKKSDNWILIK